MILCFKNFAVSIEQKEAIWIKIGSGSTFFKCTLFFEIFEIFTDPTGAFEVTFFSSLKIFAFSAIKDLFFLISIISIIGKSGLI